MDWKIVGVFNTEYDAIKALDDLRIRGYHSDHIFLVGKEKKSEKNIPVTKIQEVIISWEKNFII